ncbi:MAG: MBL fold metallo-hydrolase [Chitinispirillales bacterium]|jgi:glyoxylase-like metal-dependent hydrolase (beta-lactamase superfamily II)|nr:MBL fold metallo-hydrolase [Chitinispirillales bacterium]
MYKIECFKSGRISTNSYLLIEDGNAVLIDAPPDPFDTIEYIKKNKINLRAILLTHCHFDHFLGIFNFWDEIDKNIPLYFHSAEHFLIADEHINGGKLFGKRASYNGSYIPLEEGKLSIGNFVFDVYHIPGHTPGGIVFLIGADCFSGDSLFAGTVGRSDWGYSDGKALIENIKSKLFVLSDSTNVLPGHGYCSTIGEEKANNPFFK